MRHAKIKSGFTTEGTEFTEGESCCRSPTGGAKTQGQKPPWPSKLNLLTGIDFTQDRIKRWRSTFPQTRDEPFYGGSAAASRFTNTRHTEIQIPPVGACLHAKRLFFRLGKASLASKLPHKPQPAHPSRLFSRSGGSTAIFVFVSFRGHTRNERSHSEPGAGITDSPASACTL